MANLVDKSGDAYSNVVRQASGTSLTFPMPGNVPLDVESVTATIDNTAGAATTATLVVRDASGEVIGTKRMDDTFPAGDTGTVTFTLRNAASGGSGIKFAQGNTGTYLVVHTTGTAPSPPAFTTGDGVEIIAQNAGIFMEGSFISLDSDRDFILEADRDFTLDIRRDEQHTVQRFVEFNAESFFVDVTNDVQINPVRLGFFSVGPVVQQATPVTLGDVIALLQAYGLAA